MINPTDSTTYTFGEFRLETENLLLLRNSEVVPLAPKACEVLLALVEANGKLLTRQEILDTVWADSFVEEANLTHHISALRKALGEDRNGRKFIETIPRKGYRFVIPIREIENSISELVIRDRSVEHFTEEIELETGTENLKDSKIDLPVPANPPASRKSNSLKIIAVVGLILTVILASGGYAFYHLMNRPSPEFHSGRLSRLTSTGKTNLAAVSPNGMFVAHIQQTAEGSSLWVQQVAASSETQILPQSKNAIRAVNFSPDGNFLYYILGKTNFYGTLFQIPVLGGQPKKIADNIYLANLGVNGIGFSPDGKKIAFVRLSPVPNEISYLMIADADGTNETSLLEYKRPELLFGTPAWSPDGATIVCPFQSDNGMNALKIRVADGSAQRLLATDLNAVAQILWLPDQKNLLMLAEDDTETVLHQVYQVGLADGSRRRVNQDFNNYESISLNGEANKLIAVRTEQTAHLWTMPFDDSSKLKQITNGFEKYDGVNALGWLANGNIFYESIPGGKQTTLETSADGNQAKQLFSNGGYGAVSPDGRFIVYQKSAFKNGRLDQGLFLFDKANSEERRLTTGWDLWAEFSPDNKTINFIRWGDGTEIASLRSVSIDGGEPLKITRFLAITCALSPDSQSIAVARWDGAKTQIVIVPATGGEPIKTFNLDFAIQDRFGKRPVQWSPDRESLEFIRDEGNVSNIWRQPVNGGEPIRVTNFSSDLIFNFASSPDGKQLALSRGTVNSDVVLIENAK